uniref:Uncharacterized protein n=2 Tax=Cajanus cajan TaxID=3821 RepID=A0A151S6Z0_CAJCA|nr:hypothetical protein KK1_027642 [Cajanus cajan]
MFTLCLILISHSPLLANARVDVQRRLLGNDSDLISQICNKILHDKINCTNILRADPRVLQAKTLYEFSKAVLELALKKGIEGQNLLKELEKKVNSLAIAECANSHYNVVVGSFKMALIELKQDPQSANYDAKVAGNEAKSCETFLVVSHIVNPVISAFNHQISLLSNIAFLATNKFII